MTTTQTTIRLLVKDVDGVTLYQALRCVNYRVRVPGGWALTPRAALARLRAADMDCAGE